MRSRSASSNGFLIIGKDITPQFRVLQANSGCSERLPPLIAAGLLSRQGVRSWAECGMRCRYLVASFLALALARRGGFLGFLFQYPALALRLNCFRGGLFQFSALAPGLNAFGGSLFSVELRMDAEFVP
jgi:hypothetical protein